MDGECNVEDVVTMFLLNTTRLRPQLSRAAVQALIHHDRLARTHADNDKEGDAIPLTTGSVAELYIEPMLQCFGDIDVMCHHTTHLAIPRGHPPPTQLPDEFHNYVKVSEIIDSHLPGYVYLALRYLLTECVDDSKYYAVDYERRVFASNNRLLRLRVFGLEVHGPAQLISARISIPFECDHSLLSADYVTCSRCLEWPPQAANWPTRHRNYGWPDSATVDRVANIGCDVVAVAHRQCRQHEWMSTHQWRLSFSRAEIILINSWMPVQQIVYHVLRVFLKTSLLADSADNSEAGKLSNYHIKTLMLWACELKPRNWWTDDVSLVRICVELLHDLAVSLTGARYPHYFVDSGNLIDSSFDLEMICSQLVSINKSWLSSWFVSNYMRRCAHLCPQNISRLFADVSTTTKLQKAASAIVNWKLKTVCREAWDGFEYATFCVTSIISRNSLTVRTLACWLTELRKISENLTVYLFSVVFLHVACRTATAGLNDELMDVLAIVVGQSIGPRRYSSQRSSVVLLNKAVNLMKAVDDRPPHDTVRLIKLELTKAYLYRAISCVDSDSDSIYCLLNVYLAVLYYTTGQYQTAIDHCAVVLKLQDHSQCISHLVQGELLPKMDDSIDIVLGLAAFYEHVRTAALNQQQQTYVTVFTTELFAHYLHIKSLSVTKCQQLSDTTNSLSSTFEVESFVKYIADTAQPFITDILLWKLVSGYYGHKFVHRRQTKRRLHLTKYLSDLDTSILLKLLQQSALEKLTTFRQMEAREFGNLVAKDFDALLAYKRGDYLQCLHLSRLNFRRKYADNVMSFATYPEFIQLLDDDIVSLTALTLIVYPECREGYSRYVCLSQLTFSLYLMIQCQLKLRHSVMSLTQTLEYITDAHRNSLKYPMKTMDRLVLEMIAHKAVIYINGNGSVK